MTVVVRLLADVPELIDPVGRMRWAEWGNQDDVADWIATTRREAGRDQLPVTWVATDDTGTAIGAVALGTSDVTDRPELVPCVWGMAVRTDFRSHGVGRQLLNQLEHFAVTRGYQTVWVSTGPPAVSFYERCGYRQTEPLADGVLLRKQLKRLEAKSVENP